MKIQFSPNTGDKINKLKANCFMYKTACEAFIDLPPEKDKKLDKMEDFFEETFEELSKNGTISPITRLIRLGDIPPSTFEDVVRVFDSSMKEVGELLVMARRDGNLPAEMLFTKLFNLGLFGKPKTSVKLKSS